MLEESPEAVAVMVAILAVYVWYVVDLPPVQTALTVLLAVGVFLLSMLALEKLRARYGVDVDGE